MQSKDILDYKFETLLDIFFGSMRLGAS